MSIDNIERLAKKFVKDYPELTEGFTSLVDRARQSHIPEKTPVAEAREQFLVVRREFKTRPHTPDLLTRYWQARWSRLGRLVGTAYEVPDSNFYQDEIEGLEHMSDPAKLLYLPDQLETTPEGLVLLGLMHPKMDHWSVKPTTSVTYDRNGGGWGFIQSDVQTPYPDATEENLDQIINDLTRANPNLIWFGPRLATYIIGSQDSKDLTSHYFDENGWVFMAGAHTEKRLVRASFSKQ